MRIRFKANLGTYDVQMDGSGKAGRAFGERVRELRKARHLTQAELGSRAGLSGKFVGQIERGGNPTLVVILAVADALSVRADMLFTSSPVPADSGRPLSPEDRAVIRKALRDMLAIFPERGPR